MITEKTVYFVAAVLAIPLAIDGEGGSARSDAVAARQQTASWESQRAPRSVGCLASPGVPLDIAVATDPSKLGRSTDTTVELVVTAGASLSDVRLRVFGRGHATIKDLKRHDLNFLADGQSVRLSVTVRYDDFGESTVVIEADAKIAESGFRFSKRVELNVLLNEGRSYVGEEVMRHLKVRAVRDELQAGRLNQEQADREIRELTRLEGTPDDVPFERIEPTAEEQAILDLLLLRSEEAPQRDKQPSLRGGVNIRVRGLVEWLDENGARHPVYGMTVQVRDDEVVDSEGVRELVTDQNGQYDTGWFIHDDGLGAGNPDIFVRFRSENGAIDVEDGCFACPTYENDMPVHREFGGGEIIQNFTCDSTGTGPACSVLTGLTWIAVYASNLNNGQFLDKVRADWPGDTGSSNYNCTPACRINVHPDDRWDWDVLHHEYGHHVMNELGFEDSPGGTHAIDGCHAVDRGDKDDGMKLAWAEGWPTFFGLAGQQQLNMASLGVPRVGDENYDDTINQTFSYSIEANSGGIVSNSTINGRGEDNELAVQRVLWDLFDSNNDSRDSVSVSDEWLFDVFSISGPHSLNAAWASFRAQLADAEVLAFGNVLTDHAIGPRPIAPADGTEITMASSTFIWTPDVGCDPAFAGDLFELVFYRASNQTPLFSLPGLTNTTYTLTPAEFATLQIGGPEILWAVEGINTAGPTTGPYLGANSSVVAYIPPLNDSCGSATTVNDGIVSGTTNGASADGSDTCLPGVRPDVWHEYTASCTGRLIVDACGSDVSTIVSIHNACPGTFQTEKTCDAGCLDVCGSGQPCAAQAEVTVAQGNTYLIRAAAASGTGDFTLNIACNANADTCDEARPIAIGDTVTGTTTGAQSVSAPTCNGVTVDSPGVWYSVLGNGNLLTASLCNANTSFDTRLSVYCGGCTSHTCLGGEDDSCGSQAEVSWCAAPGAVYFLLVHSSNGVSGDFELEVRDDGSSGCGPFYINCAPANNFCSQAVTVGSGTYVGDNTNAGTSSTVSCQSSNGDVWYRYTPDCHGFVTISTCGAGGTLVDTVLTVYDECDGNELACNDDFPGCGFRSELTVPVRADESILIRVADFGATVDQGTFSLSISGSGMIAPLTVVPPGLYITDGAGFLEDHLLRLDSTTGAIFDVGSLRANDISGLAYSGSLGLIYGINDTSSVNEKVTVNPATGAASAFNPTGFSALQALAFDVNTLTMYGSDIATGLLVKVDPFGILDRAIGAIGFTDVRGLAFDPDANVLYGSDVATDQLVTIDTTTGVGTAVGPFGATFNQIEGLAFDAVTGTLYGVQNDGTDGRIVVINKGTGSATQIAGPYAGIGPVGLTYVPALPDGKVGTPYAAQVPLAGGCPDYVTGNLIGLPPGLSMNSSGFVHGDPVQSGHFTLSFFLDDTNLSTPQVPSSAPLRIRPAMDDCQDATPVPDGAIAFDTRGATTDGPDEPAVCDASGYTHVGSDVWFCHTAECTGDLTVSLCDSDYDTKLAVYEGCECPVASPPRACNDDFCGGLGLASEVTIPAISGQRYMIRVGGYAAVAGSGHLSVQCTECTADGDCEDGNLCTSHTCQQGRCALANLTCNDSNPCTTDSCSAATGCRNTPIVCDDENACTTETCNPANGVCDVTPLSCDDGNVCTGIEACDIETGCVAGTPLNCDDSDSCTADSCDAVKGCVHEPLELMPGMLSLYHTIDFSHVHNANLQLDMDPGFPAGTVTLGGVPFDIPASGVNYWHSVAAGGPNPRTIEVAVNRFGVQEVHTLINTYWGQPGPASYAVIECLGSDGAYSRKDLVGNADIRDWNDFIFTNAINGTTTQNVVLLGPHRLDKQMLALPADFHDETLLLVRFSDHGNDGLQRAFLAGLTVKADALGPDCNGNGRPDECDVQGDADGSGAVDLGDWLSLHACLTGPCMTLPCDLPLYPHACCSWFDHDTDNDIDLADLGNFQHRQGWHGQPCAQPHGGIVGWWSGDDTFEDWAGTNDATPINGANLVSGLVNAGIATGPGAVYAQTGNDIAITGNAPRTLCAWVKSANDHASSCCATPVSYGGAYPGGGFGIFLSFGHWWFWGYQNDIDTGVVTDTNWNHHCLAYDGTHVTYYLNGTAVAAQQKFLNTGSSPLVIGDGFDHRADTPFEGVVDEILLYDHALLPAEIRQLYDAGSAGLCR